MTLRTSRRTARTLLIAALVAATATLGGCVVEPCCYGHGGYHHGGWGWHHYDRDWR